MRWNKKGLIFGPNGKNSWAKTHCLQPTPLLISPDIIRVFTGFRDQTGISRVGYVDLKASDPSQILYVTDQPVLDIGEPGCFDENGVVPTAIVKKDDRLLLYYAGYQLGMKVRFFVFGGLAESLDGGKSFRRVKKIPILDRTEDELFFRVAHSVLFEDGQWKAWYGGGSSYRESGSKTLPVYDVRLITSSDGINFPSSGKTVLPLSENEHRIGRPYVIRENEKYFMFYGHASPEVDYRLGYAISEDGVQWKRQDEHIGIAPSGKGGWDSTMMAYPSICRAGKKVYMFYNGNEYGKEGFGYAELESW